jgi:acyl carrier protein
MDQEIIMILKNIFHAIAPEIDFDEIDFKKSLRGQVEIDSLDFYRIMVLVHQNTCVSVPDSKLREFQNLDELIHYISAQSSHHQPQLPGL